MTTTFSGDLIGLAQGAARSPRIWLPYLVAADAAEECDNELLAQILRHPADAENAYRLGDIAAYKAELAALDVDLKKLDPRWRIRYQHRHNDGTYDVLSWGKIGPFRMENAVMPDYGQVVPSWLSINSEDLTNELRARLKDSAIFGLRVNIDGWKSGGRRTLAQLDAMGDQLLGLDLEGCKQSFLGKDLRMLSGLKCLSVSGVRIDDFESVLDGLPMLEELSVSETGSRRMFESICNAASRLNRLSHLSVFCSDIEQKHLAPLAKLPLQYLELDGSAAPWDDAVFAPLAQLQGLRDLRLRLSNVTSAQMARLKDCARLEVLSVNGGESDLSFVTGLPKLRQLALASHQLYVEGSGPLDPLVQCQQLHTLSMRACRLETYPKKALNPLGKLAKLYEVSLVNANLGWISFPRKNHPASLKRVSGVSV